MITEGPIAINETDLVHLVDRAREIESLSRLEVGSLLSIIECITGEINCYCSVKLAQRPVDQQTLLNNLNGYLAATADHLEEIRKLLIKLCVAIGWNRVNNVLDQERWREIEC